MRKRLFFDNLASWVEQGADTDQDWIDHAALQAEIDWTAAQQAEYQKSGSALSFGDWLTENNRVFSPPTDADCLSAPVSQELKNLRTDQVRSAYSAAVAQGCLLSNGIRLQCGDLDLDRWVQLTLAISDQSLTSIIIRDYGNGLHTISAADWVAMRSEMAVYVQGLLPKSWALKDQAAAAATLSELLAVKWQ